MSHINTVASSLYTKQNGQDKMDLSRRCFSVHKNNLEFTASTPQYCYTIFLDAMYVAFN